MKREFLMTMLLLLVAGFACSQTPEDLLNRHKEKQGEISQSNKTSSTPKETSYDTQKGKNHIDWDMDYSTMGGAYSYSPHFPLSISVNGTWSYFQIGGEVGLTFSMKQYDLGSDIPSQPIGYIIAQPGFYCKYASVQCGVGALFDSREETSISTGSDGVVQVSSKSKVGVKWCIKPSVTGFIPICYGEYYITINAGYIFIPKFKELNGFTVGVGFQITIN